MYSVIVRSDKVLEDSRALQAWRAQDGSNSSSRKVHCSHAVHPGLTAVAAKPTQIGCVCAVQALGQQMLANELAAAVNTRNGVWWCL